MYSLKGYIDGNTVVAIDNGLHDFAGSELLIQIVEKPQSRPMPTGTERLQALKSLQGIIKGARLTSIAEIKEERLKERYGL